VQRAVDAPVPCSGQSVPSLIAAGGVQRCGPVP
jgi:hypothetical protein